MKKILYSLLALIIVLLFFLKPITIFFIEKALTKSLKREVAITSLEFYPLKLDATIQMKYFPQGIDVHAKYTGGLSLKPKSIGKFIITSTSLGGNVEIQYEHYIYNINVDSVDFVKLAQVLNDKKHIVQKGVVNGTIIYHKKTKIGSTDLKITKASLKFPDINQGIKNANDAINLNIIDLFSEHLVDIKKDNTITEVDHFQFDIDYIKKKIIVKDVALRTDSYRVSLVSKLDKKGEIDYFYIHLLDEDGCAVITQELQENIKKPKRTTSPALQTVVQATPKSFFSMGKRMIKYGSDYAGKQTGMSTQANQITSYIVNGSETMFKSTSNIMLKNNCEVIYNGKVKHPKNIKSKKLEKINPRQEIDIESSPTLYRERLLL